MKYEFHPFTKIFPMVPSHEIDALAADIKKFGQRVPIVIYGGKILDGRNRYEACKRAKVEPPPKTQPENGEVVDDMRELGL